MSGVLARYLRRLLFQRTLGMLLALAALFQVIDLLDATTDVLERGLGARGVLRYALLRLPAELSLALPLAVLLGAVLVFQTLMKNHEIVAMRAAGVRPGRILLAMLPVLVPLAVLQLALSDRLAPAAETELAAWWRATAVVEQGAPHDAVWARTDRGLIAIDHVSADARALAGLHIYLNDESGQIARRLVAERADWQGGYWRLANVSELAATALHVRRSQHALLDWHSNLRPDDLLLLDAPEPRLSSTVLLGLLRQERVGGKPSSYYRTTLYRTLAAPAGLLVMLLLALPAMRGEPRGNAVGAPLMLALGNGLAFMLVEGLMASLGESGRIAASVAVLSPLLLFGAAALAQWVYLERT